ncbi:IS5 family transposase [Streptomyces sp. NPDC048361]|uniref:IS5 family transposase n=1 Tax=Streptomyces sp. NPDC048361 TaxID=3154720 RepID=UPI003437B76C
MVRPKPWDVDDKLRVVVEPLLPKAERRPCHPGRKRHSDRLVFQGILFVLDTGITWEHLPQELGFGSGMTCWRRPGRVDRGRSVAPAPRGSPRRAPRRERPGLLPGGRRLPHPSLKRGPKTGRSPVDRGRTGSKHHLITDATGIPLAVTLTGGNRNDVTQLIPLLQAVPPVRGKRGRPRCRPDLVVGDRGYDHDKYRRLVRDLGVKLVIARRGTEHGSGLGAQRWVVEHAFAHLHWFRRLRIRWELRDDIHEAFLTLGCALICWRRLAKL